MNILIAPALGVLGLIAAFVVFSLVMRYSDGTDQVKKIGDEKCFKVRQCQAIDIVGYVITLIKSCVLAKFYSPN